MPDPRDLAALGALVGDPARAHILTALMSGVAMTATELALEAQVVPSTASAHLAKLTDARLLTIEKQGRHRYYRLASEAIADMLENLMGLAAGKTNDRRAGPRDPALRAARVCYDHLAGERGVWLLDMLKQRRVLAGDDAIAVSGDGKEFFARFGIDLERLGGARRPLCRTCLDWSERRHHLSGALGAAILQRIFDLRWAEREPGSRVVVFSASGERALRSQFET